MTLDDMKARLRAEAIARRDALSADLRRAAAEAVARHGLDFTGCAPGTVLSGYAAIGTEIDPLPLLAAAAAAAGYWLALPELTPKGQPLVFRAWSIGEPLRSGLWGIREPLPEAPAVDPDVLLVPLLAFDRAGRRLGYGGGYYDRTIARLRTLKPVIAIGLAYDEQEITAVPADEHDQMLDWVLTPRGARRSGA